MTGCMTCNLLIDKNPQIFVHPVFMMQKSSSYFLEFDFVSSNQRETKNDWNFGTIRKYRSTYSTDVEIEFTGTVNYERQKMFINCYLDRIGLGRL